MSFQKGHKFYGDLSKPNYFKKGQIPWNAGTGNKCIDCGKRILNKTAKRCRECYNKSGIPGKCNKGKKRSIETREKLSKSHIGQEAWNKGKGRGRIYLYYPYKFTNELFRESIKKRDDYKCRNCGITEEENITVFGQGLSLHHIDYDKTNCNSSNLVTVCRACNARANCNREHWKQYYQNMLKAFAWK